MRKLNLRITLTWCPNYAFHDTVYRKLVEELLQIMEETGKIIRFISSVVVLVCRFRSPRAMQ